jgi:mannose-6-phosphate isomerase
MEVPSFLILTPYERPALIWGTERWVLSDRVGQASTVVGGPFAGASLTDLIDRFGARLAGREGLRPDGRLKVLVKLLETRDRLSVQVHPGWDDLGRLPPGAESKEEAWLVLRAEPGARIFAGTRPGCTREALAAALREGAVEEQLASFEPRAGDVVHLRPGTLHAIGAGISLAEVQESSDTTYRVWDWGRVEADGRPRALHVAEALAVTRFDLGLASTVVDGSYPSLPSPGHEAPFSMAWVTRPRNGVLQGEAGCFVAYTLVKGRALVDVDRLLEVGQTVLVPPGGAAIVVDSPDDAFLRVSLPSPCPTRWPSRVDSGAAGRPS